MKYQDERERCHACSAPFVKRVKFNNGNPVAIPFPTCTCAEEAFEAQLEQRIKNLKARRQENK